MVDGEHPHTVTMFITLTIATPTLTVIQIPQSAHLCRKVHALAAASTTPMCATSASKQYALPRHASSKRITRASAETSARTTTGATLKLQNVSMKFVQSRTATLQSIPAGVAAAEDVPCLINELL